MVKGRILSGMQPTGKLHLGNLEGALRQWVQLQHEYEMFCCIVDWHALTTMYETSREVAPNAREVAIDYLAAGLDPAKCSIFIQSHVKEHAELHLLFSMITPLGWLERVPTYKEKREQLQIESASYGLLGYPVLQAADILVYKANLVPVGKDQLPHLELTREICRRFNYLYGEVFPEPQALVREEAALLPGIDGRKMSKSYGNTILIADAPDVIRKKVSMMFTDPEKIYRHDPGHPERCPVFAYWQVYGPEQAQRVAEQCRTGELGCVQDKKDLAEAIISALQPIHQRRRELESAPDYVESVLAQGAEKARAVASVTMDEVRKAMGLY
ncbi:MAG: tryptophan--tRNA ligase [Armatimonadota bacterium]